MREDRRGKSGEKTREASIYLPSALVALGSSSIARSKYLARFTSRVYYRERRHHDIIIPAFRARRARLVIDHATRQTTTVR